MTNTDPRAPKDVTRALVDGLFGRRDAGVIASEVAPEARDAFLRQAVDRFALLTGIGDYRWSTAAAIDEGAWAAVVSIAEGSHVGPVHGHPPTGRRVRLTAIDEFRVDRGRVVEARLGADLRGLLNQLVSPARDEPVLELSEIQGNVIPGFRKDHQALVFMEVKDPARARAWLHRLAAELATASEVLAFNRLFSEARARRGYEGAVKATWLNVALSHAALVKLGADPGAVVDAAFREGAYARAAGLGEPSPDAWIVGGPARPPEILVIAGADDPDDLADELRRLEEGADGVETVHLERGDTLPGALAGHEHFGFADGISHPGVRGRASTRPDDFITERSSPDPDEGRPGQPLVWPGEFVFGYPEQDPIDPVRPGPPSDGGAAWTRNGSLLSFRRYRQEAERFHRFWHATAQRLGLAPELLEAKAVGRWASGAPLSLAPDADDPALGADAMRNNAFDFAGDADGAMCPRPAHIRKAYPRADTGPGGHRHRLLRRGIPFTDAEGVGDSGLLFLAYQTSLERQFEFVLRLWIDNPDFLRPGDGIDPLIGHASGGRRASTLPVPGRAERVELPEPWTVPTGGGYFFAPSVSALRELTAS